MLICNHIIFIFLTFVFRVATATMMLKGLPVQMTPSPQVIVYLRPHKI